MKDVNSLRFLRQISGLERKRCVRANAVEVQGVARGTS